MPCLALSTLASDSHKAHCFGVLELVGLQTGVYAVGFPEVKALRLKLRLHAVCLEHNAILAVSWGTLSNMVVTAVQTEILQEKV